MHTVHAAPITAESTGASIICPLHRSADGRQARTAAARRAAPRREHPARQLAPNPSRPPPHPSNCRWCQLAAQSQNQNQSRPLRSRPKPSSRPAAGPHGMLRASRHTSPRPRTVRRRPLRHAHAPLAWPLAWYQLCCAPARPCLCLSHCHPPLPLARVTPSQHLPSPRRLGPSLLHPSHPGDPPSHSSDPQQSVLQTLTQPPKAAMLEAPPLGIGLLDPKHSMVPAIQGLGLARIQCQHQFVDSQQQTPRLIHAERQ